jgi:hypothetical protein
VSTILSSMSEIVRVGGWALRGIGYPFGVAERGVRLLAWSEAAGGEAIKSLRLSEAAVERSHSADPCERQGDPASGRTLHAKGRHLIEIGAPAIDLVTHDARHASIGHVAVDGVFGLGFLPSLANLIAHRKLSGIFFYGAADADRLLAGWPRTGWLVVQTTAQGTLFAHGDLDDKVCGVLRSALAEARGTTPARFADRALTDIEAAVATGPLGYMGVLAVSDERVLVRQLLETVQSLPGGAETIDFAGRVADALTHGVPINADDLRYLYDLELRTWAPTSERSRSQAGYGVY